MSAISFFLPLFLLLLRILSLSPGDEMFSDSYKIKLIDDVIYEVYGKVVNRVQGEIQIEGFNPSAEEADEGTDASAQSGVDIVLNSRLCECFAFNTKKDFTLYLKDYMKKWVTTLPSLFPFNAKGMRHTHTTCQFIAFLCVFAE